MRKLAVLFLALTALVAAACGESEVDLVDSVAGAADSTLEASTARVTTQTDVAGQQVAFDGVFDFGTSRARLTADGTSFGLPGETEFVYDFADGLVMYLGVPAEQAATVGADWIELDLAALMAQTGIDVDLAEIIQSQSADPSSGLQFLRGASAVEEIGTEELRGVETRHLAVTISLAKLVEESPEDIRDDMQALVDLYTVETLDIEVWLDDDDRVRKYVQTIDYDDLEIPGADLGELAGQTVTATTEYYEFGVEADIVLPDPSTVVSFEDLLGAG